MSALSHLQFGRIMYNKMTTVTFLNEEKKKGNKTLCFMIENLI